MWRKQKKLSALMKVVDLSLSYINYHQFDDTTFGLFIEIILNVFGN